MLLAFVYFFAALTLVFAQDSQDSLLKSTSAYIPRRANLCDLDAACTQAPLPLNPTTAQCQATLSAVMYQPWTIAAKLMETKSQAVFDPIFQWFVDGPLVTAQQFSTYVGVAVQVYDALGILVADIHADGSIKAITETVYSPYYDTMRSRSTNIPTFDRFDPAGLVFYSVNVWNWDAQMYTVTLSAPIANLPAL